jgi:hypothetical protein
MEKLEYLPFISTDEITIARALETNAYIAELEIIESRSLSRREIFELLTGVYDGPTFETAEQHNIFKKVGKIANNLVVKPKYKSRVEIPKLYIDVLNSL